MPLILIKNNLKLMLRSKWILVTMIILPLITIALLSNAFKDMMETNYKISDFKVGYSISDNCRYKDLIPQLKEIFVNNNITLQQYPDEDITKLLQSRTTDVFVHITDDSYELYQSSDKKTEAAVADSILSGFFYKVNETITKITYEAQNGIVEAPVQGSTKVVHEVLDTDPIPSSTDYYGIIYIVYCAWCGMVSLTSVISSERKSAIPKRMRVSHMSKTKYYIGKFVPCTIAVFLEVCAAWILSVLLFDIHWGNIGISIGIVFLLSMAATAFGMVLFQLFNNAAISIVVGFIIIWVAGFFGGSFQTYIYAHLPQHLVDLTPIYYVNRTLVEFSTMGRSDYTGRCIAYLTGIIVVFGFIGILMMNRRMEEQ